MTTSDRSKAFVESDSVAWQSAGEGIRRKILGYDRTMMMVVVEFKKGSIASVHRHIHTQVTFVESGRFEVQIGSEKKVLSRGDCFLALPNIDHGVIAREDGCLVDVFSPMREEFLDPNP
jgi:quercetin dioxygenase-like cupin family protein